MKTVITHYICPLFFGMIIFTSCIKKNESYNRPAYSLPPVNVVDTLTGKEFRFDSLIWAYDDNVDNVVININNRPDLFRYPRSIDVFLMPDSSSGWVYVRRITTELPSYYGFLYGIVNGPLYGINNYSFGIFPRPADVSLEGKIVSVKVKF